MTLRDDVPTPAEPENFDKRKPDPNVLLPWLQQQGFKSLVAKYAKELGAPSAAVETMAAVAPAPQLPRGQPPAPAAAPSPTSRSPPKTTS